MFASAGSCDRIAFSRSATYCRTAARSAGVAQDDVHERVPHVRGTAERLDIGRTRERPDDRLGDLGFNHQRTAGPLRVDDDLRVGDVGNGVERRDAQRVGTQDDQHGGDRSTPANGIG